MIPEMAWQEAVAAAGARLEAAWNLYQESGLGGFDVAYAVMSAAASNYLQTRRAAVADGVKVPPVPAAISEILGRWQADVRHGPDVLKPN